MRALNVDGIHGFEGIGGVGEHGLQQLVSTGNHRGISAVDFFHLVRAQVVHHGTVGADGVGVEVGLLAQGREPAARAAGDEDDVNPGGAGGLKGTQGPRTEPEIVPDEGAVQVAGDEFNHADMPSVVGCIGAGQGVGLVRLRRRAAMPPVPRR